MGKLCSAAALVAVVLAGGAFTTSAHAATGTEHTVPAADHTVPADGPDWCGPLHDDNTIPPPRKPDDRDSAQGRHSSMNGAYCSGDAGSTRKPGPQGYYAPKTPKTPKVDAGQRSGADQPGAADQRSSEANPNPANPASADRRAATGEPAGTGAKP
ncbi:MAG TPA: hypothetical protein VHU88_11310 [Sporichthyaceae bacterium]|jgi:hypothetical protein|nr:hypothetical protein [Sporichthyaceae bacterium]